MIITKMAKFPIVFFIILAAPATYSVKPSSSSSSPPSNLTWRTFNFRFRRLTEKLLNEQLDVMLEVENQGVADKYFIDLDRTINSFTVVTFKIVSDIGKMERILNAALRSDEENSERNRNIIRKWIDIGRGLARKSKNSIAYGKFIIAESRETIKTTKGIFDELRSYKAKVKTCFEESLTWISSMRCKNRLAKEIESAIPTIENYVRAISDLRTLLNEIDKGEKYVNLRLGVPAELLKFHLKALAIVENAENGMDLVDDV